MGFEAAAHVEAVATTPLPLVEAFGWLERGRHGSAPASSGGLEPRDGVRRLGGRHRQSRTSESARGYESGVG